MSLGGREVVEALDSKSKEISDALQSRAATLTEALSGQAREINATLGGNLIALSGALGESVDRMQERVVQPLEGLSTTLGSMVASHADSISATLGEHRQVMDDTIGRHREVIDDTIGRHRKGIDDTIGAHSVAIRRSLESGSAELDTGMAKAITSLDNAFAAQGGGLTRMIGEQINDLRSIIDDKGSDFVARLGARGGEMSAELATAAERAAQAFDQRTTSLMSLMARRSEDLLGAVNAGSAASLQSLGALTAQIGQEAQNAANLLRAAAQDTAALSSQSMGALTTQIGDEAREAAKALKAAAQETAALSSQSLGALSAQIGDEAQNAANLLRAAARETAALSSQSIGALAAQISDEAHEAANALRVAANETATTASQAIVGLSDKLRREAEHSAELLRDTLERSGGGAVVALSGAGDRLRNELLQVLDRLGATSATLEQVVQTASSDLESVRGGLADRVGEFERSLGAISSQIAALGRASATTQKEAAGLAERLGEHVNSLAGAAHDLGAMQSTFDDVIARRRDSLANLIEEVAAKSDAFENLMQTFTTTVEDSLNRALQRAKDVQTSVAQTTNGAARQIGEQFETIRDHAGKERERTTAALEEAYEQANTQLSTIMNLANDRFKQTAASMRATTVEITRELEATRQELQRGVLELPRETSEQAAAMRRVVGDQIKALNELAELVARAGGTFDVAEPAAAPSPIAPARTPETPRPEPVVRPQADFALQERPRPMSRPAAPAPTPAPALATAASVAAARGQGGWLSDLLSRASREDGELAPASATPNRPAVDQLDGISLDIAALIDPPAATEMWDRWRQGDTSAFSRRLYTAQGQQTFDEIRRRYRADLQFRETVNKYVQEFERLLAKIGRDDRDGSQSRDYTALRQRPASIRCWPTRRDGWDKRRPEKIRDHLQRRDFSEAGIMPKRSCPGAQTAGTAFVCAPRVIAREANQSGEDLLRV